MKNFVKSFIVLSILFIGSSGYAFIELPSLPKLPNCGGDICRKIEHAKNELSGKAAKERTDNARRQALEEERKRIEAEKIAKLEALKLARKAEYDQLVLSKAYETRMLNFLNSSINLLDRATLVSDMTLAFDLSKDMLNFIVTSEDINKSLSENLSLVVSEMNEIKPDHHDLRVLIDLSLSSLVESKNDVEARLVNLNEQIKTYQF